MKKFLVGFLVLVAFLIGVKVENYRMERGLKSTGSFYRGEKVRYIGKYDTWYDDSCDIRVIAQQATEKANEVYVLISHCKFFIDGGDPRSGIFNLEELVKDVGQDPTMEQPNPDSMKRKGN